MRRSGLGGQYLAIAAFAAVCLLLGWLVHNSYYQLIITLVLIWATAGVSWNMLSGYSGMISFGHAAFFGLGGYAMTIAFVQFDITPWIGIPLGVLVGMVAAIVIGLPTFRLRGHYFALSMLAYPLAMLYVFEWLGYQEVSLPMKREAPALYAQFGAGYGQIRFFRRHFIECIALAIAAYPEARVDLSDRGLILRPSRPAVPKIA